MVLTLAAALITFGGRVVEDHTGNPLASVEIQVSRLGVHQLAAHLETNTEGRFEAEGLPDGEYRLRLSKRNFLDAEMTATLPLSAPLAVRLVRTGVILGQVTDGGGRVVPAVYVHAMQRPAGGGPLRRFGQLVTPNDRGQFRIHGLPPGQYLVAITYGASTAVVGGSGRALITPGIGTGSQLYPSNTRPQTFTVSGGEEFRGIDFTLTPGTLVDVSGKVEGRTGQFNYWVALSPAEEPSLASAVAQTAPDGSFKIEGVPAGSYYVFASGPSRARGQQGGFPEKDPHFSRTTLNVATEGVKDMRLAMDPGRSVSFVLRSKSASCPASAKLTLTGLEDWAMRLDATADLVPDKPVVVENLAPSRYAMAVSTAGDVCFGATGGVLDLTGSFENKPVEIAFTPAGTLRGRTAGGKASAVALLAAGEAVRTATPDANGAFSFPNLKPGRYRLAVQTPSQPRWLADYAALTEVEVLGGVVTNVELSVPVQR